MPSSIYSVVGIAFIRHRLFQRCNRRLEEMYGWGRGELDGQPTRVVFFSDEAHERAGSEVYEALRRGETFSNELIQQRRDGEPFWVRVTGKAIGGGAAAVGGAARRRQRGASGRRRVRCRHAGGGRAGASADHRAEDPRPPQARRSTGPPRAVRD